MGSAEEKLDRLMVDLHEVRVGMESLKSSLAVLLRAMQDHEERLRGLERWQNHVTPVLAIGTFVCGAFFQLALTRWLY